MRSQLDVVTGGRAERGDAALAAAGVTRRFGKGESAVQALRGVSLEVSSGELVALMGRSGSGKSTLLHILGGLDRPTSGDVVLGGARLYELGDDDLTRFRNSRIGFVFQSFNLLPLLTAEENVVLPLALAGERPEAEWVDELIERVGLSGRRRHRSAELSGGETQRAAIARALVNRPDVVIADEPTGNLDSRTGHGVLELLHECSAAYGQTIVMATHEAAVATIADRILLLSDGRLVDELAHVTTGELAELVGAPAALAV